MSLPYPFTTNNLPVDIESGLNKLQSEIDKFCLTKGLEQGAYTTNANAEQILGCTLLINMFGSVSPLSMQPYSQTGYDCMSPLEG